MATISIERDELTVAVQGLDKLWTLKSQLTIPLTHVRGATADPGIVGESKGWRGPGMVIEVDDPRATVELIESALAQR